MSTSQYSNILNLVFSLRKYCRRSVNTIIQSPSTTTYEKSFSESLIFSEIPMAHSQKFGPLISDDLEAMDILIQIQSVLVQYEKCYEKSKECLDHITNFLQNFLLLGEQMESPSLLMIQSYKYCIEHINSTVQGLKQFPKGSVIEGKGKIKQNSSEVKAQNNNEKINRIIEEINKVVDQIQEQKGNQKNNKEIENLKQKINQYEKERQTFIRIHDYYQRQLGLKVKDKGRKKIYEEPHVVSEEDDPDLPTFNYTFVRQQQKVPPLYQSTFDNYSENRGYVPRKSRIQSRHRY